MFLNAKEIDNRFAGDKNIASKVSAHVIEEVEKELIEAELINKRMHKGTTDNPRVPDVMRTVIGAVTLATTTRSAGKEFGVAHGTAANLAKEVKEKQPDFLAKVAELAVSKVNATLVHITDEKLQDLSAKSLSEISRNLSSVIRNTSPENRDSGASRLALTIHSPMVFGERHDHYFEDLKTIEIVEEVKD